MGRWRGGGCGFWLGRVLAPWAVLVVVGVGMGTVADAQAQPQRSLPTGGPTAPTAPTVGWWDRLWHTADQRGQARLQQGDAAAAARTFADPRRKAYAELKAGDYAAASRDLAPLDDRDAHYNRGNALARAGDLPGALKAYDAALRHDPADAEARRNRDLVAQAMARQQRQQAGQPPGQQSGRPADQQQGGQQQGSQQNGGQPSGGQPDPQQGHQPPAQPPDAQTGPPPGRPTGDQPPPAGPSGSAKPNPASSPPPAAGAAQAAPAPAASAPARPDDAALARQDAQSGLGQARAPAGPAAASAPRAAPTRTEQQLSQEQWLRSIPDDPGGLLRRKFLIEHLMRQRENAR